MKGMVIGIAATVILILVIPLLFIVSQEKLTSHTSTPTPTPAQVLSFATGQATIAGYVFHDDNKDGERQEEEQPAKNIPVELRALKDTGQNDKTLTDMTDSYGYFSFRLTINTTYSYLVKIIAPKNAVVTTSNPVALSDMKPNMQKIIEFGLNSGSVTTPSVTKNPIRKVASSSATRP